MGGDGVNGTQSSQIRVIDLELGWPVENHTRTSRPSGEHQLAAGLPPRAESTSGLPAIGRVSSVIIATLREHEEELKTAGIVRLSSFGSYARGTAVRDTSDIDFMAEFDSSKRFSLLDMVGMENRLADILGVPVDLAPVRSLK